MHFMVKVILIDFQLEKYMKCKEKCLHFSCSIDVTVTSQNGVTSFYMSQRAYRFFLLLVVLKWLEFVYGNTKMKI